MLADGRSGEGPGRGTRLWLSFTCTEGVETGDVNRDPIKLILADLGAGYDAGFS